MENVGSTTERGLIFVLRMTMAWTFLFAASHQVFVAGWSATGFLEHTKTFHWLFQNFTGPVMGPIVSALVKYGHLLIGLSLLFGAFTRAGSLAGIVLMLLYWMAHMDFPYITNTNNFLVDSHIVYAVVLALLMVKNAGHVWGLDGWLSKVAFVEKSRVLNWAST